MCLRFEELKNETHTPFYKRFEGKLGGERGQLPKLTKSVITSLSLARAAIPFFSYHI